MKVLFLIESGSRGWGFESNDSDYDMRGIYIDNSVFSETSQFSNTINDIDIVLWNIKKFLKLMIDSNPSVWEWLSSEVIYIDHPVRKKLKLIFERDFSRSKLQKHYISMAKSNFHKYINNIGDTANLKKYVYILRSIACSLWIEQNKTAPPKDYRETIHLLPNNVRTFFKDLVKQKQESEALEGKRNEEVERYIISFFDKEIPEDKDSFNIEELERIYNELDR